MKRRLFWTGCLLWGSLTRAAGWSGQEVQVPPASELAAITERGRELAEYDAAAWHASDAVQAANPRTTDGQHCLARKENRRWTVVFGALNHEKTEFLIRYEAEQTGKPGEFAVKRDEPAKEDQGFYLFAARALELALADFGPANRPYNSAVLAASERGETGSPAGLYVYLYPAATKTGIYPVGGDVRYLVSPDGAKILAKRQMHKTVIEAASAKGKKVGSGFHTHALSDEPEDTDVLHVLQQDPSLPEVIGTQHFLYEIAADGAIRVRRQKK